VTSPVHDMEIVIGKWLAAILMYGSLLLIMLLDISFLFFYGQPDWKPVATGFVGILLQGAALLALGADFMLGVLERRLRPAGLTAH